jgi:PAS domain S-box-containing protein
MVATVMTSIKEALSVIDINSTESEKTPENTKNLLQTFLNTNPYGVVVLKKDGKIKLANKMVETLFGYSQEEMIDKHLWDLALDGHQRNAIKTVVENIFSSKPNPVPYFGAITNKKNRPLQLRVDWDYLHTDKNTIIGILAVVRNTANDQQLQKFHSPSIVEQVQYSRLASIEEVVARIAHELNQPLSAILNFSHGALRHLEKPDTQEEVSSAIHMISKQAQRAGDVLQRIRGFIQKGELRKDYLNINEIIQEVLDCMRQEIHASNITTQLNFNNFLPAVLADKIQVEQVLLNLIQNAIEAMSQNDKANRLLTIETRLNKENNVAITISDNGTGILPRDLDQIFDAFHSTKEAGMGIGLAISQSIILAHHGKLTVDSKMNEGSIFTIILPPK